MHHFRKQQIITNFCAFFVITEPSVLHMEGPSTEQSEQILQGQSMSGPVGACHKPSWPMTQQWLYHVVHLLWETALDLCNAFVGLLNKPERKMGEKGGVTTKIRKKKISNKFARSVWIFGQGRMTQQSGLQDGHSMTVPAFAGKRACTGNWIMWAQRRTWWEHKQGIVNSEELRGQTQGLDYTRLD